MIWLRFVFMEWRVERNEIGSVRSRDLVSLLLHIIVADLCAFPPKRLLCNVNPQFWNNLTQHIVSLVRSVAAIRIPSLKNDSRRKMDLVIKGLELK